MEQNDALFLGFDLSTQQLKIIAINNNLKPLKIYKVDFDTEYAAQYGVKKGVLANERTGEVIAPVTMWVEALDLIFKRMKDDGFPFNKVKGISGSCQQHGSVYWSKDAPDLLANVTASKPLREQLSPKAFTYQYAPNWQDHSTGPELEAFEKEVGGAQILSQITGSRAHYRFTGAQIRKLATRKDPELYRQTFRISLVSSFLSSLLSLKLQPMEESDACGMNLYDIKNSKFDERLLGVAAGTSKYDKADPAAQAEGSRNLLDKLGSSVFPVGHDSIGTVGSYFVEKYGFSSNCKLYAFTGDNNATILALPLASNDVLISMGTSTTVLLVTNNYKPSAAYHVFKHPTLPGYNMGMLCYCNGALAREKVRDAVNASSPPSFSWDKFNAILDKTRPLNGKLRLGIYFPKGEIIPNADPCERRFYYDVKGKKLVEVRNDKTWTATDDVAAIVESQALSCRLRAGPMLDNTSSSAGTSSQTPLRSTDFERLKSTLSQSDISVLTQLADRYGAIQSDGILQSPSALIARPNKLFFVGGSSKNSSLVSRYCDILGAKDGNYRIDLSDACALGGCYKALWSYRVENEGLVTVGDYGQWLNKHYNWDEYVERVARNVENTWRTYVDGVGILSLAEQRLGSHHSKL